MGWLGGRCWSGAAVEGSAGVRWNWRHIQAKSVYNLQKWQDNFMEHLKDRGRKMNHLHLPTHSFFLLNQTRNHQLCRAVNNAEQLPWDTRLPLNAAASQSCQTQTWLTLEGVLAKFLQHYQNEENQTDILSEVPEGGRC